MLLLLLICWLHFLAWQMFDWSAAQPQQDGVKTLSYTHRFFYVIFPSLVTAGCCVQGVGGIINDLEKMLKM